jgi:CRP/FNR family cyclic AMP-dependent transcriptional regulator
MELQQFLNTLPAFQNFTPSYVGVLAGLMQIGQFPAGKTFIEQGQQGEAMYLLMDGAVEVKRIDDVDSHVEVRELRAGELFGLLSLIGDMPASATCTAKEPATVAALPREAFQRLFDTAAPVGHHLQYMVAVQLARDLQERNKSLRQLLHERAAAGARA